MKKIFYLAVMLCAIFLVGAYLTVKSEKNYNDKDIRVSSVLFTNSFVNTKVTITNSFKEDNSYQVTAIPFRNNIQNYKYYFYSDNRYPVISASYSSSMGVLDHLQSELKGKSSNVNIEVVNASELKNVLNAGPSVVIMTTGVMPDTVLSDSDILVRSWLEQGGIIIWVGDGFGYYYGKVDQTIKQIKETTLGWQTQKNIFGSNLLDGAYTANISDALGDRPGNIATALGVRYRYTQTGVFTNSLTTLHGFDLGWNKDVGDSIRTSLSWVPVGRGGVVVFGSGVLNREVDVAWDISQIIVSDILCADISSLATKTIDVPAGQTLSSALNQQNYDYWKVKIIVFNKNQYYHDFYVGSYKPGGVSE